MIKLRTIGLLFALLSAWNIQGQEDVYYYANYQWDEVPSLSDFEGENSFVAQDHRILEYQPGEQGLLLFKTVHKIIWVNDDNALERFNKVFIPLGQTEELLRLDARSIKANGEIVELNKDNIKELSNLEEYGNFKIFAIEGAEVGSVIEYVYTLADFNELAGNEVFQEEVPIADAQLILRAPQYLEFDVKAYNGLKAPKKYKNGSLIEWRSVSDNITPLYEEIYATMRANRARIAYRLKFNKNSYMPKKEIMSWVTVANRFREITFVEAPKGSKKLLKDLKIEKMKSEEDKIKALEKYIKNNIALKPDSGTEYSDIADVLERKFANELGMLRLYASLLQEAEIPFEVVIGSNRYNAKLDPEFPDFDILGELMIHFPQHNTYLNPDRIEYRYGFPSVTAINNYALFLTPGNYRVEKVQSPAAEENMIIHESTLSFTEDLSSVTVDKFNSWTGYRAYTMRTFYKFQSEEGRKLVTTERVSDGIQDAVVKKFDFKNMEMEDSADKKPLIYNSTMESSALIENAGNLFLVNVGQVIGTQTELYQERERTNPIEMDYPIQYTHKIEFEVPKGFEVKGLEDGNFIKKCEVDGELVAQFDSKAKVENGKVSIEVLEFYTQVEFPKEQYEEFRSVINAAADFNKLVLILEKK